MILKLKADGVTVIASSWSAGANEGEQVLVRAHGGTIGLTMNLTQLDAAVDHAHRMGEAILDLQGFCEDPSVTRHRLYQERRAAT